MIERAKTGAASRSTSNPGVAGEFPRYEADLDRFDILSDVRDLQTPAPAVRTSIATLRL